MSDPTTTPPAATVPPQAPAAPPVAPPVTAPVAAPQATPAAPPVAPPAPYVNPYARPAAKPAVAAPPPVVAPPVAPPAAPISPELAALTAQVEELRGVVAITATVAMNSVPDSVRAYVLARVGDNPAAQVREIEAMRAAGLIAQPIPAGATTTPAATSPAVPPQSTVEGAVLAEYERLRAIAPIRASMFRATNSAAIASAERARKPS